MPMPSDPQRSVNTKRNRSAASAAPVAVIYGDYLRNVNWKLVVFCVALWWFIYSAPTEGLFTHFWAASNASQADDF